MQTISQEAAELRYRILAVEDTGCRQELADLCELVARLANDVGTYEPSERATNTMQTEIESNLSTLVARLVRRLRKYDVNDETAAAAYSYLERQGLLGSPLRKKPSEPEAKSPADWEQLLGELKRRQEMREAMNPTEPTAYQNGRTDELAECVRLAKKLAGESHDHRPTGAAQ